VKRRAGGFRNRSRRPSGAPETFQAGYPGLPSWAIVLQSLRDAARALGLVGVQALRDAARALALVWRPGSAGRREGVGVGRHPGSAGRREGVGVGRHLFACMLVISPIRQTAPIGWGTGWDEDDGKKSKSRSSAAPRMADRKARTKAREGYGVVRGRPGFRPYLRSWCWMGADIK